MQEGVTRIEIEDLVKLLPHRYPFLLIDRIVEIEPGVRVTAVKNLSADEPFFAKQDGRALSMPGLLIIEAMAQTGAVLLMVGQASPGAKLVYFAGLDHVSWPGVARPGDQLRLEIEVTRAGGRLSKVHGVARVESRVICEADMSAVLVQRQ